MFCDINIEVFGVPLDQEVFYDEDKLQGKTRADIPENRQNLLRFLEEKGWLYQQFKI